MRNATQHDLVCHLESYTLCIRIHEARENSLNHAISCRNLS